MNAKCISAFHFKSNTENPQEFNCILAPVMKYSVLSIIAEELAFLTKYQLFSVYSVMKKLKVNVAVINILTLIMINILRTSLVRWPYLTNSVLATSVMGVGDYFAQRIESNHMSFKYDRYRAITMMAYAGFIMSPYCVVVYSWINKRIIGENLKQATKRGIIANLLMNPIGNLTFYSYSTFMEVENSQKFTRFSIDKIKAKLEDKYLTTCIHSCFYWIPLNIFNFWFMPLNLRVFTAFVFAALWNCYLSFSQHSKALLKE